MRTLLVLVVAASASGCGFHNGLLRDSTTVQQVDLRMDISQVRFLRPARGSDSVGMLFCSIPIGDAMYAGAMEELYTAAHLGPNELLVNFREDHAFTSFLFFWCRSRVTLSADVVQVTPVSGTGTTMSPLPPPPLPK